MTLGELIEELSRQDSLRVGQEVGTMAYLVHDAVAGGTQRSSRATRTRRPQEAMATASPGLAGSERS